MKGIFRSRTVVLIALLGVVASAYGQDSVAKRPAVPQINGYIKQLTLFQFARGAEHGTTLGELHNRLATTFSALPSVDLRIEARTRLYYGEGVQYVSDPWMLVSTPNGDQVLSKMWYHDRSFVLHTIIDRLYLDIPGDTFGIRIGRQRLNWGINTIWTPNDIFNSYSIFDFDYEEGPGTDAVRVRYTIEPGLTVEGAGDLLRSGSNHTYAGRAQWNIGGYDLQFLLGVYEHALAIGGGFAGNIGDAGVKGECTFFDAGGGKPAAGAASLTFDHVIGGYYLTLSGLLCTDAPPLPSSGAALFDAARNARQLMPFRYTGYAGVTKNLNPLLTGTVAVLYSPTANSVILFPRIAYSLADNVDADMTVESYLNDASGKFAAIAHAFFLRVRWSF